MERAFFVNTPIGKLKIYAKLAIDTPEEYPGVYVDLVRNNGDLEMLACVEYDSCNEQLQTCVYQPGEEFPCEYVVHDIND